MMAKNFLGRGWKFPILVDPTTGRIEISEYEQDVREAIWIILSTARGERVMRPDFGCGIHDLVFAPINAATIGEVDSNVREALINFEPRIEIINLDVSDQEAHNGKLLISIDYRVRMTNNEFNLVYPFYFTEGT
jgi:hypothetical protein